MIMSGCSPLVFAKLAGVNCRLVYDVAVSGRKCLEHRVVLSCRIMKHIIGVRLLLDSMAPYEEDSWFDSWPWASSIGSFRDSFGIRISVLFW
ncbi:unnamed protein product [Arabidopsis halleri]